MAWNRCTRRGPAGPRHLVEDGQDLGLPGQLRDPVGLLREPQDPVRADGEQFVVLARAQLGDLAAGQIRELFRDQPGRGRRAQPPRG